MGSFVEVVSSQALLPRREIIKAQVLEAPKVLHRLTVKFRDDVRMRATPGGLVSLDQADLAAIKGITEKYGCRFKPLINLSQEKIDFITIRAERASGRAQPDFAGMMIVEAPLNRLEALANDLNALDQTEYVYFQYLTPPPPSCVDVLPTTPSYVNLQGYHSPDPGMDVTGAWALSNARGLGVKIVDCEYGYVLNHEDLCGVTLEPGQTIHPQVITNTWDEHGTAVLGELVGTDNIYGVTGMVPDAEVMLFTEWSLEEGPRRVTSIANAISTVDAGDVVLLEMQTTWTFPDLGPAEFDPAIWLLTRNASDAGIIVVAAAGNGSANLDAAAYLDYMNQGDSGALIVGAGSANSLHDTLGFSTYGSRVNLQGWGTAVVTLGYGTLAEIGGDKNQRYSAGFSGTSSASPFVAAACVAIQGLLDERSRPRLTPQEMRDLLINTGIPQGSGGHIGPLPDILAAALFLGISIEDIPDCNNNGINDTLEFVDEFQATSGELSPIGLGFPVSHTFIAPPEALSDVTMRFTAVADLGSNTQSLDVYLNDVSLGLIFRSTGSLCPAIPDQDQIIVPMADFIAIVSGGDAVVRIETFDGIFWSACAGTSYVTVSFTYDATTEVKDVNGNSVPDECDLARGDNNLDGAVNVTDLLNLLAAWGACESPGNCPPDTNLDDLINVTDLLNLLAGWG